MNKFPAGFGAALVFCLYAGPASAQATRTWVANNGNDTNTCSATAPCKTFAAAFSKTFINGEINCLDAGAYGVVTITKSITIDCHENFAGVLANNNTTGVIINIPVSANDPLRTVRLRNLAFNGTGTVGPLGSRTGAIGIRIDAALAVFVDNVQASAFTQQGLSDRRTAAGKLYVKNSTFRDNATGMQVQPSTSSAVIKVVVENSHITGNATTGISTSNGPHITLKRSVVSGNGTGMAAAGVSAASQLTVDDSVVSANATGFSQSGTGSIRISNSDVAFNTALASGTINTFTNSRFTGNGAGGVLATIGAVSNPSGQQ